MPPVQREKLSSTRIIDRQFVYKHLVYYYILAYRTVVNLCFSKIIIFVNSNFYLHYDSFYQSRLH